MSFRSSFSITFRGTSDLYKVYSYWCFWYSYHQMVFFLRATGMWWCQHSTRRPSLSTFGGGLVQAPCTGAFRGQGRGLTPKSDRQSLNLRSWYRSNWHRRRRAECSLAWYLDAWCSINACSWDQAWSGGWCQLLMFPWNSLISSASWTVRHLSQSLIQRSSSLHLRTGQWFVWCLGEIFLQELTIHFRAI